MLWAFCGIIYMEYMKKRNIKIKLILWIVLIIFVFGGLAAIITYITSKSHAQERTVEHYRIITTLHADRLATVFNSSQKNAENLARQKELGAFLLSSKQQLQDKRILSILESGNVGNEFSAIYLMDLDGTTIVSTNPTFVGKNYGFRDYFKETLLGQPYIDVAIGVTSKQAGYYFTAPVFVNTEVIGVLVMKQLPDSIHSIFEKNQSLHQHKGFFLDEYGVVVGSNQESSIYRSFGELTNLEKEELVKKKRYSNIDLLDLGFEKIQNHIRELRAKPLEPVKTFINKTTIFSVVSIGGTKFNFAIEEDLTKTVIEARQESIMLSLTIALMALLAICIIVMLMNRFFVPFNSILLAIKRFSKDKCAQKLVIKTGDEFEQLANEFNNMAQSICGVERQLEKQSENLKKKVKDLERVNRAMIGREKRMAELKDQIIKQNE